MTKKEKYNRDVKRYYAIRPYLIGAYLIGLAVEFGYILYHFVL